ncbi:unnamed protein product [Effrenium voratum]|nr:unnamed protein product [Effrenium voratum]
MEFLPLAPKAAPAPDPLRSVPVRPAGSPAAAAVGPASRRWSAFAVAGILLPARARAKKVVRIHSVDSREVEIAQANTDTFAAKALDKFVYPAQWPYRDKDFFRLDQGDDAEFYKEPRLVKHLEDKTLQSLTAFYAQVFPTTPFRALDLCSSWVSHYPSPAPERLAATGMNAEELQRNAQATDWTVQDLNAEPKLPYKDQEFDVVTNTVSVDYLTKPLEVFREVYRVLRPGGLAIVAFSNRCFLSKLVSIWRLGGRLGR